MIHQKNAEHVREAMVLIHPTELHKRFIINIQYKTSKQYPTPRAGYRSLFIDIAI